MAVGRHALTRGQTVNVTRLISNALPV